MQTQELEWDEDMVARYGVEVSIPEHPRLEIPLHHSREVVAKPGGFIIKQLPEFIQFQYEIIRNEQAKEIEHFSSQEQDVFGSHLVPRLYLERLSHEHYMALADSIHAIGKEYNKWTMDDYLLFMKVLESLAIDGGNCDVQRHSIESTRQKACLIYDSGNVLRTVGILDQYHALTAVEPTVFFGLAQSFDGLPLHTEEVFVAHCLDKQKSV